MAAPDLAAEPTTLAQTRTNEALVRTRLAYERTMMAWVRTATSLMSFGFTIYKFFDFLRQSLPPARREQLLDPRGVALVMISLGVGALVLATFEHRSNMKVLRAEYGPLPRSLSTVVAGVVASLGVVGLLLVFFRQ